MMTLECLPAAEPFVWHIVVPYELTEAIVEGESLLTRCGKRMPYVTDVNDGSGGKGVRSWCEACQAIEEHRARGGRAFRSPPLCDATVQ